MKASGKHLVEVSAFLALSALAAQTDQMIGS
jgi:hypothetical protein